MWFICPSAQGVRYGLRRIESGILELAPEQRSERAEVAYKRNYHAWQWKYVHLSTPLILASGKPMFIFGLSLNFTGYCVGYGFVVDLVSVSSSRSPRKTRCYQSWRKAEWLY